MAKRPRRGSPSGLAKGSPGAGPAAQPEPVGTTIVDVFSIPGIAHVLFGKLQDQPFSGRDSIHALRLACHATRAAVDGQVRPAIVHLCF